MQMETMQPKILALRRGSRRRRWWRRAMVAMAAVVVFVTTYLLILPAITMEHPVLELSPQSIEAAPGEAICTEVCARAGGTSSTTFLLLAQGENAGLLEEMLAFDGGTATVYSTDGTAILFHGDTGSDGVSRYWFTLEPAETACFTLSWQNGVTLHGWEDAEVPEPEEANEPEETAEPEEAVEPEEIAEPSDDVLYAEEAFAENMLQSSLPITEIEPEEPEEPLPPAPEAAEAPMRLPVERVCGDPAQPGTMTLFAAAGTDLTGAEAALEPSCTLAWANAETSDEQEAAVLQDPDISNILLSPAQAPPAADGRNSPTPGQSHDLTEHITTVTVSKQVNSQWQHATEFVDGDLVLVEISYSIDANVIGADNRTLHYQLPEGIRLSEEETGQVYDGEKVVGSYTINPDGMVVITFQETFADDKPFSGHIQFQGKVHAKDDGTENQINFGGNNTITVKPNTAPTDVSVEKTSSYSAEDGKLHYTLTVSTTKGTNGAVTVHDSFGSTNTHAAYDRESFVIVKVDANGQKTPVEGYAPVIATDNWDGAPEQFTLSGLPALVTGESYQITYTATPEATTDSLGASSVNNSVSVTTAGGDSSSDWNEVVLARQMLAKWGSYDQAAGVIRWTITLNPDNRDIGGWKLQDTITTPDGITASLPDTVTLTGANGEPSQISLPYEFPSGSTDSYTVTYETPVTGLQPGQQVTVSNKAEVTGDGKHYEVSASAYPSMPNYQFSKSFSWHDAAEDGAEQGIYHWSSSITVPGVFDQADLPNITYTDTLLDAAAADGAPVEGSHYITASELREISVTANGTPLSYDQDYILRDGQGAEITNFNDSTPYTAFQIEFLPEAVEKVRGKTIQIQYRTTVDYTKLPSGEAHTIGNKGAIPGHESEASTEYEKPRGFEKQASITGNPGSYTENGIDLDFTASGGVIRYRLLLKTDASTQGNLTVTDLLPAGAALLPDTVTMKFNYGEYAEGDAISWNISEDPWNVTYMAKDHIHANVATANADGTTPVTFTIDEGYNGDGKQNTLAVYYQVSIAEDPRWAEDPGLEQHTYTNTATWGTSSAETDVRVTRDVPEVAKTGVQLPQLDSSGNPVLDGNGNPILSDTLRYSIIINQGAKDLVPDLDYITLWDKLDSGSASGALFQPNRVYLYHYDWNADDHLGREIDRSLYAYTYDESQHLLTFQLPDETACVLVYEYTIERGNAAGDLTITNEAHLTGGDSAGAESSVVLAEISSSATATKRDLTVYKVDATNYGKLLPGAKFQLEEYDSTTSAWRVVKAELVTDESGQFTLSRSESEDFGAFNFQDNTLYRLTETQPPTGYASTADDLYFVWVKTGSTADAVKAEMSEQGKLGGVSPDAVRFLTTSASLYVPNEPTALTVKKVWQDNSGVSAAPGAEEVGITLYQQAVVSNAKTVTVQSQGNPQPDWVGNLFTCIVNVAEGSDLTIHVKGVWTGSLDFQVGTANPVSVSSDNQQCTYTVQNITADTTITIYPTEQTIGTTFDQISFSDYTTPFFEAQGDAAAYGTVTLNDQNSWSYTWNALPKTNAMGQTVYYHVAETTPVPGYEVIYSSNNADGVGAGELVVINRTQFLLPETGGAGTTPFITGGILLLALAGLMYVILWRKGEKAL